MAAVAGGADVVVGRIPPGFDRWDDVLVLLHDSFAYMTGRIDPPSSLDRMSVADLADKATAETVILATDGQRVVGCAFTRPAGDVLYLGKIAVDPAFRRHGLLRRMLAVAEAEARERGLACLELQSRVELIETHEVFYRLGFSKFAETAHAGYDRPTSFTMRKPL